MHAYMHKCIYTTCIPEVNQEKLDGIMHEHSALLQNLGVHHANINNCIVLSAIYLIICIQSEGGGKEREVDPEQG